MAVLVDVEAQLAPLVRRQHVPVEQGAAMREPPVLALQGCDAVDRDAARAVAEHRQARVRVVSAKQDAVLRT